MSDVDAIAGGEPIGLIAGGGALPGLEVEGLHRAGRRVVGLGLSGQFEADLPGMCDAWRTAGVLRVGSWTRRLRAMGARQAVMVGRVSKRDLMRHPVTFVRHLPDWTAGRYLWQQARRDMRSQTLLAGLADLLAARGIELIDTTRYIPDHLASVGPMTMRAPTAGQAAEVAFGWPVLEKMNELDVGQAIAVRGRDVVAVEGLEGTDAMIARAGQLARQGWVLLKGIRQAKTRDLTCPRWGCRPLRTLRRQAGGALRWRRVG